MREYFAKIYKDGYDLFLKILEKKIKEDQKAFVITANPETLMIGTENAAFDRILRSEKTMIVPDGIGVVKAANMLGYPVKERVTGVEIVQGLFRIADRNRKTVYLLGAKEEVVSRLAERIKKEYRALTVVGYQNGYVKDKDAVFEEIRSLSPDIILVALGIPAQELLIARHYDEFDKGVFVGVGGSFDVLSGMKKRAPAIFIRLNLEWLYRIVKEPRRFGRFYKSNVKFISEIRKMR